MPGRETRNGETLGQSITISQQANRKRQSIEEMKSPTPPPPPQKKKQNKDQRLKMLLFR